MHRYARPVTTIPLIIVSDPDDPDAAEVLIDGTVNGRPRRFLLDTGAARTRLVADQYTYTLPSAGEQQSSGALAAATEDLVLITEIAAASGLISAHDLTVSRVPADQPGARDLIGMDVFRHYCLRIQLDRSRLTLETSPQPDALTPLVTSSRHHPYVDLTWPGAIARTCLDTGSGVTVVDQQFLDKHPDLFTLEGSSIGLDANGGQAETPTYRMRGPVIGGIQFDNHPVVAFDLSAVNATTDIPMDFILGYPTLRQAEWLLDFPAARWSARRNT